MPMVPTGPVGLPAALLLLRRRCALVPSIVKYHWHPAIPTSVLAQATQGRKWHMWTRDQTTRSREFSQQLISRRRSRSLADIEDHRNLGMRQLDALCMDDVAPKQDFLSLGRKFIAGMSWGMTRQRDDLHAVDDWLGDTVRVRLDG